MRLFVRFLDGPLYNLVFVGLLCFALGMLAVMTSPAYAQAAIPSVPTDPTALSTKELWAALVGIFVPLLASLPMQPSWPNATRAIVGVLVSVLAALGTSWFNGYFQVGNTDAIARSVMFVLLGAWSSYGVFWKQTGITARLEYATSGKTAPPGV